MNDKEYEVAVSITVGTEKRADRIVEALNKTLAKVAPKQSVQAVKQVWTYPRQ